MEQPEWTCRARDIDVTPCYPTLGGTSVALVKDG